MPISQHSPSAVHQNYVGTDTDKQPYFLSIVSQDSANQFMPPMLYRVMLFRKEVSADSVCSLNILWLMFG